MDDRSKQNVKYLREVVFGITQRTWADWFGLVQATVGKWESLNSTSFPPVGEVAWRTGVSSDWIYGQSTAMWSERVHTIRSTVRAQLAATKGTMSMTPSHRFRLVVSLLQEVAPDLVTDDYLAALLRLTAKVDAPARTKGNTNKAKDHSIAPFVQAKNGDVSVEQPTIAKLAEFAGVPFDWFYDGDRRHVDVDPYAEIVARAKRAGVRPEDLTKFIAIFETKNEVPTI